jgi:hypothetical protein
MRGLIEQAPLHIRDKLLPICEKLFHYARLQNQLVKVAQDAVDQLQLDVKYLLFDLEATRRERDALMTELEDMRGWREDYSE